MTANSVRTTLDGHACTQEDDTFSVTVHGAVLARQAARKAAEQGHPVDFKCPGCGHEGQIKPAAPTSPSIPVFLRCSDCNAMFRL